MSVADIMTAIVPQLTVRDSSCYFGRLASVDKFPVFANVWAGLNVYMVLKSMQCHSCAELKVTSAVLMATERM